jgi:hypothetical protein
MGVGAIATVVADSSARVVGDHWHRHDAGPLPSPRWRLSRRFGEGRDEMADRMETARQLRNAHRLDTRYGARRVAGPKSARLFR